MIPTRIEGADGPPIDPPPNWNEVAHGHCAAISVRRVTRQNLPFMESAWEPEPGEMVRMLLGAKLILGINAEVHPVCFAEVGPNPPDAPPVLVINDELSLDGQRAIIARMVFPGPDGGAVVHYRTRLGERSYAGAVAFAIEQIETKARAAGLMT